MNQRYLFSVESIINGDPEVIVGLLEDIAKAYKIGVKPKVVLTSSVPSPQSTRPSTPTKSLENTIRSQSPIRQQAIKSPKKKVIKGKF